MLLMNYGIIYSTFFKSLRNCDRSNKVDFVFTFYVKLINIESLDLTRKVNFEVEKILDFVSLKYYHYNIFTVLVAFS